MKTALILAVALALAAGVTEQALAQTGAAPRAARISAGGNGTTRAQISLGDAAFTSLLSADANPSNFITRVPFATQDLKGLLKTKPNSAQAIQALLITLRDITDKSKLALASTKAVQKRQVLFDRGKMSYADYQSLFAAAEAGHKSLLSATNVYLQVYKKISPNASVQARAVANYCGLYAEDMARFETAYGKLQ